MSSMFEDTDFDTLRADQLVEYPLEWLHYPKTNPDPVVLLLKCMGPSNKPFTNARMRAPKKTGAAAEAQATAIFCRHVIVGWKNVLGKDGKPVDYSPELGVELLDMVRSVDRGDLVGELLSFAMNAENFRAPIVDTGDLGNS